MKKNKVKLRFHIWFYLVIFSLGILLFLWLFQIMFLNKYYHWYKNNEMIKVSAKVLVAYENKDYEQLMDAISYRDGVCVEIIRDNQIIYQTSGINRGCVVSNYSDDNLLHPYQIEFIESDILEKEYQLVNGHHGNDILVRALKLDDNSHLFVNASLVPMDSTIVILKNQFIYVTTIVLILSFVVSYYISRRIAAPIVNINKSARELAVGNYDVNFDNEEDIYELSELSGTLNYTKEELSKTEALRREFLANISHDLKTPLTMIKAYAEMIRDISHKDIKKTTEHLNVIISETDRLNLLVNDILELSKIQTKTIELDIKEFDLVKLTKNIISKYDILVEQDDFLFNVNAPSKVIVKADEKRIEQVMFNLINNAVNYTGIDKKVLININETKDKYVVSVIDTGKGIREEELGLIWDKFLKLDKTYSRDINGSGLGLSIVKNILEAHNFQYGVKSKINKGTTFYFEIPKLN